MLTSRSTSENAGNNFLVSLEVVSIVASKRIPRGRVVRTTSYSTLFNMDTIVSHPQFDIRCFKRVYTRNFIATVHACGSQIIRSLHTEWSVRIFYGACECSQPTSRGENGGREGGDVIYVNGESV